MKHPSKLTVNTKLQSGLGALYSRLFLLTKASSLYLRPALHFPAKNFCNFPGLICEGSTTEVGTRAENMKLQGDIPFHIKSEENLGWWSIRKPGFDPQSAFMMWSQLVPRPLWLVKKYCLLCLSYEVVYENQVCTSFSMLALRSLWWVFSPLNFFFFLEVLQMDWVNVAVK